MAMIYVRDLGFSTLAFPKFCAEFAPSALGITLERSPRKGQMSEQTMKEISMNTTWALGALLAAMAVTLPAWHADAQSRGGVGGYSSGPAIGGSGVRGPTVGGGSLGNNLGSRPAINRAAPAPPAGAAPVTRQGPSVPLYNSPAAPRYGTSGLERSRIGRVRPETNAITVPPR